MSIKDFFYKKEVVLEDQSKLTSSVESADLIEQIRIKNKKFVPDVDFSDPANFARFGSAKEYYEGSIKRIYEQYPYDGSEAEKLEFYNNSTYLDQWLFDNKYPKSTGYGIFSADGWGTGTKILKYGIPNTKEYIFSAGDLREAALYQHTASSLISQFQIKEVFDKGVIYDESKNRTIAYKLNPEDGATIQFWLKKDEFLPNLTEREVILDLWNGELSSSNDYGRLLLELSASNLEESVIRFSIASGSTVVVDEPISLNTYNSSSLANGNWQHHTITLKSSGGSLNVKYYNNGVLNKSSDFNTTYNIKDIKNRINGYIGGLQTTPSGSDYHEEVMVGGGKLSASMDDFRYWKKDLDAKYIKNTWFYPIGGGSNSDDYRTDLGVYYKFNEGITGLDYYDSVVLDYSGRITNGTWTGYGVNSRSTGSAFLESSLLQEELKDPIIRVDHPSVTSLVSEMNTSGSLYDKTNTSYMFDSVPEWLRTEDSNDNIKYLFQILSSYFDTLYCQIKELPRLKEKNYFSGSSIPHELVSRLITDKGLTVPGSFLSADVLSQFWQRDNHDNYFEQDIERTKRLIYYNIYNNLDFILKSKGTEKSFRNLLRCFGVDDEVIKLNVYTDNATHYLKDRYKKSSLKTKFVNFNEPSRFSSLITQTTSSNNSLSFISGSQGTLEINNAFTMEGDVIFPSKFKLTDNKYFITSFLTSSLFGFNQANPADSSDYTYGGDNDANLQFYSVREFEESSNVKFVLRNKSGEIDLHTDFFKEVYEGERWNFSITISPVGYPFAGSFASSSNPDYSVEAYGVCYNGDSIKSQFTLTSSISNFSGSSILTKPKRFYIGADRSNFTGSINYSTDVKIGSFRVWFDKLSNEAIQQHNLDPSNYGHNKIYGSPTVFTNLISNSYQLSSMDSLVLHWNFNQNNNSDTNGEFIVEDFSSGSTETFTNARGVIEVVDVGGGLAKHASLPTTDGFTITDSDGNAIEYFFDNTGTAGASGAVTSDGVVVQINGLTHAVLIASQIAIAIESSNGHGTSGTNTIKVLQRNPPNKNFIDLVHIKTGPQGNITITPGSLPSEAIGFSGLIGGEATVVDNKYGWTSNTIQRENKGLGLHFPASEEVFNNEFIYANLKELPEISFTDDRIIIMDDEKEFLIEDEDTTDNVFSLEKSMNQSISEQMMKTFSTMKEYANLFAKPVDYYRQEYKRLRKARSLFFERINGNPDFEKFTEYFKWIDTSISFFIEQLKPASITFTDGVSNVVESHIFERPKYQRKFPRIKEITSTEGNAFGVNELTYNWKFGHSPEYKNSTDNIHCLWKKTREERTDIPSREKIRRILEQKVAGRVLRLGDPSTSPPTPYLGQTVIQAVRRFSSPYKLSVSEQPTIHGGTNYNKNKNRDFIFDNIKPHGSRTNLGIPVNVVVVGVGPGQGIISSVVCDDIEVPNEKEKYDFRMTVGKDSSGDGQSPSTASLDLVYEVKSAFGSPFNILSGNVSDGANKQVDSNYKNNVILTNLHSDTTYVSNDVPLQSPYTETWVGGRQNRHVEINRYDTSKQTEGGGSTINNIDDQYSRPEAYRILFGEHPDETVQDGAIGIVGPDYGGPYPDTSRKWAIYYRDFRGKKPYSIKNIKSTDYRKGNYTETYEYINTTGRQENNSRFKKSASESTYEVSGVFLPAQIKNALPQTTHPMTLVSIIPSSSGNVFGIGESNRINSIADITDYVFGTGSFEITGATQYLAPHSASLDIQGIPKAAQHDFISFKISGSSNLSNGDFLQLTASSTDKLLEVVTGSSTGSNTDIVIEPNRRAFRCNGASFAHAIDSTYSGLSTNNFSVSLWVNSEDDDDIANCSIRFAKSTVSDSTLRGSFTNASVTSQITWLRLNNDIVVNMDGDGGDAQVTFDTNIRGAGWTHIVVTFPVEGMSSPMLWVNGSSASVAGSAWSSPGGAGWDISKININVDDNIAFQDVVIWKTLLTGSAAVAELYNGGVWRSPTLHTSASVINDWYMFGNEQYWKDLGLQIGQDLNHYLPSSSKVLSSSFGTGGNDLSISNAYDDNHLIVGGYGNRTNDEVWGQLTSSLNTNFSGYTATYISGATDAQFFLRKDTAGSNTVSITETGTSFDNLVSGSGATALASDLEDGDTITIDGTEFTVKHTTSGSAVTDLVTGQTYRKALKWHTTATTEIYASNTSYTDNTDSLFSVSFWMKPDSTSGSDLKVLFAGQDSSSSISFYVYIVGSDLKIYLASPSTAANIYTWSDCITALKWQHITLSINKSSIQTDPSAYLNGVYLGSPSSTGAATGALRDIEKIYVGDYPVSSNLYEAESSLQDLIIWNKALNITDTKFLYNSGSWFDAHSHPSASLITDWWLLGEESNVGQSIDQSLAMGTAVTTIAPTIGSHTLTFNANNRVFVSQGIHETPKSNVNFWNDVTQSFKDNTLLTGSYSLTYASPTLLFLTASTVPHTGTFSLAESGDTFNITVAPFKGPSDLTSNNGGAFDDHYIQIDSTRFIVDADNSNAGGNYAKVGDHYYVYSSGSSNEFWTRLTGAIEAEFTNYNIVTSSTGEATSVFSFTASSAPDPGRALTKSGISFSNLFNISATTPVYEDGLINVTQRESDFLTGSIRNKTVITSRFSAPGGIEVQTYGYLDAYAREYSVHNSLNYRNLSVRGRGSGEEGTIRMNNHANTRDGLRTLYQRFMGRGGIDPSYSTITESDYDLTGSFHKTPRNTLVTPRSGSSTIEIVERNNNYNYQSIIPASDYNYSWVTSSLGDNYNVRSGTQKVFGYWPKDGLNKINGVFDTAITFPSASDIVGV